MLTKAEYEATVCERLSSAQPVPFRRVSFVKGDCPQEGHCHENVERYVAENPGTSVLRGWLPYHQIWDNGVKQRLTSHSVVRGINGELFDITPFGNNDHRDKLVFVPHLGDEQEFSAMGRFVDCPCEVEVLQAF